MQLPSLSVEVCWRPTSGGRIGNLHEVIDLNDGRVAVAVGDVLDAGPDQIETADELRSRLHRAFYRTQSPTAVLTTLDEVLDLWGADRTATMVCAVIDPEQRTIRVANAGHLPLIFVEGVTVEMFDAAEGRRLGLPGAHRQELLRKLRPDTALFGYTAGLLAQAGTATRSSLDTLLRGCHGMNGTGPWASEFARRATEAFGQPEGAATVVSVRMSARAVHPARPEPQPLERIVLRAYLDPHDLRSRALLDLLSKLGSILRQVDLGVEVVDVTSKSAMTEEAGVLAAPTILRTEPGPAVRVIGWFDSPLALARALQLPVSSTAEEGT
jgi:hypothetical protein